MAQTLDPDRMALREALLAHVPVDPTEERHRTVLLALVTNVPECFSRTHYTPGHITGSAFIVDPAKNRVLLHFHKRLARWLQMGGHDDGERSAKKTALREAKEESGLTEIRFLSEEILDVDVHPIPEWKTEPAHHHHDVRYALFTVTPQLVKKQDAESEDLAWFPFAEASQKMNEPGADRVLQRLSRMLR